MINYLRSIDYHVMINYLRSIDYQRDDQFLVQLIITMIKIVASTCVRVDLEF